MTNLRLAAATALEHVAEVAAGEWALHAAPVDAVAPPAFILQWGPDPWRTNLAVCFDPAQLEVVVIADRLTVEGTYPIIERMVDAAADALAVDRLRPASVLRPGPFEVGNVTYFAARIQLRQPVEVLTHA